MIQDNSFEDKYMDVLQNIEFGIVQVYQKHPDMTDWETSRAIEMLIRSYQAEASGRPTPQVDLKPLSQEIYDAVRTMCEWRLRPEQAELTDKKGKRIKLPMEPKTVGEIVACLKRIRRSIEKWNRKGGRQGYLYFISQFVK